MKKSSVIFLFFITFLTTKWAVAQEKPNIYPDEPPKHPFAMSDGRTVGEGRLALGVSGGYPYSQAFVQFAPRDYIDMGMRFTVGYYPRFDIAYYINIQPIETPNGLFRLALRLYGGLDWLLESNKGDRFYFYPETELLFSFELSSLVIGSSTSLRYGFAAHKNGTNMAKIEPLGFIEIRLSEDFTIFVKAGYRFAILGIQNSSLIVIGGLNARF